MLLSLRLSQFAVVEETLITFGSGLVVLTGETGAGKSVLVDALGLLLGGRAESVMVRNGAEEAVIEGVFSSTPLLRERLSQAGLPAEGPEVLVRRVIGRSGRGRVHVNGALITVGMLSELLRGTADIAGQHDHLELLDPKCHLDLVDQFGRVRTASSEWAQYVEEWARLNAARTELQQLGGDEAQVRRKLEDAQYQIDELSRLDAKVGEETALEAERRALRQVERMRETLAWAEVALGGRDHSAVDQLGQAAKALADAQKIDPRLSALHEQVLVTQGQVNDALRTVGRQLGALDDCPQRLVEVEERLESLKRLSRRWGIPCDQLPGRVMELEIEAAGLRAWADRRKSAEALVAQHKTALDKAGTALTHLRREVVAKLLGAVRSRCQRLGLKGAKVEIALEAKEPSADGADHVVWTFSANKGEPPQLLAKVASGGEASRLLLAIKAALAAAHGYDCYVFDESDAGVGGAIADAVGRLLWDMSRQRQVLCITHLPQVAAYADSHLRIEKMTHEGRVRSTVLELGEVRDRTHEVARMLSGVAVTREAVRAAQALLKGATRTARLS